jgi:hypothetical protein
MLVKCKAQVIEGNEGSTNKYVEEGRNDRKWREGGEVYIRRGVSLCVAALASFVVRTIPRLYATYATEGRHMRGTGFAVASRWGDVIRTNDDAKFVA